MSKITKYEVCLTQVQNFCYKISETWCYTPENVKKLNLLYVPNK